MEELQIFNAQTQSYVANGLFQIAVVIGVFIVFRAARFARQNNIAAKVLVSLFGLVISFFSLKKSFTSYSKSNQDPRFGITLQLKRSFPLACVFPLS